MNATKIKRATFFFLMNLLTGLIFWLGAFFWLQQQPQPNLKTTALLALLVLAPVFAFTLFMKKLLAYSKKVLFLLAFFAALATILFLNHG